MNIWVMKTTTTKYDNLHIPEDGEGATENTPLFDAGTLEQATRFHNFWFHLVFVVALIVLSCGLAASSLGPAPFAIFISPNAGSGDKTKNSNHHLIPNAIELAQFELIQGTDVDVFLQHAHNLAPFFIKTNDAVQRSLVYNAETGVWSDIVYWTSMLAALKAANDILVWPMAQPYLSCINSTTLHLSHSHVTLDSTFWKAPRHAPLVEIAVFPLTAGVSDSDFVQDATTTTPFFESLHTARRRILAQGYEDDTIWYDVVYWDSVEDAKLAAVAIEKVPAARSFLNAIDDTSGNFSFTYSRIMLRQDFSTSQ